MRKWHQPSHVQLCCCVTGLCPVRKGVPRQPGGTQPLGRAQGGILSKEWCYSTLMNALGCSEVEALTEQKPFCRDRLAERLYTNGEWPPGRSPKLQEAAKPPEMMRKKGTSFTRVHERIPWSLFSQETIKTCWTTRQKGLCKEKGLLPNIPLYLSHPVIIFYCSNRSDHSYRLETFWKAHCRNKRVKKKTTLVFLQTC